MTLLVKSNSYDFLYLLHLWLKFYYIYGWFLLHLRWVLHLWLTFITFMVSVTFHGWLLHLWVIQQASWELVIKLVRNVPGEVYMKHIYNEYLAIIEWGGIGCEEFCDWGGCYRPRWTTSSKIFQKPNWIIALLVIQNISDLL